MATFIFTLVQFSLKVIEVMPTYATAEFDP